MTDKLSPMQQELINRADSIFASVGDVVTKAVDFGKEQIPDIAIQYVLFHRVYSTTVIVLACILFFIGLWLVINVAIRNTFNYSTNLVDDPRFYAMASGIIFLIVAGITIAFNFERFLLVWFAPKIFLIQSISNLAKGIV